MTAAPPLQYGHGLLGSGAEEVQYDHRAEFTNTCNYVLFAVAWIGMAADDYPHIGSLVDQRRLNDFVTVVDRGRQGVLNALLTMRMVSGRLARDPMLQYKHGPTIKADERYYHGNSQSGIFGSTYMALTTDVERGMLGVPGMPYSLLLNRSEYFTPFFARPVPDAVGPHRAGRLHGLAPEPTINVPATDGEDPHGKVRNLGVVEKSLDQFLRTGTIDSACAGPCDPE